MCDEAVTFFSGGSAIHPPRHVHVFDKNSKLITRVNLETMEPMDIPTVERKILTLIRELQAEGRL
ncbi:MAG: hypothetical protein HYY24_13810 [Verrucomicrobia bacterium]|nr:hypothetical protein [Verrucomicrobiota bacterium]